MQACGPLGRFKSSFPIPRARARTSSRGFSGRNLPSAGAAQARRAHRPGARSVQGIGRSPGRLGGRARAGHDRVFANSGPVCSEREAADAGRDERGAIAGVFRGAYAQGIGPRRPRGGDMVWRVRAGRDAAGGHRQGKRGDECAAETERDPRASRKTRHDAGRRYSGALRRTRAEGTGAPAPRRRGRRHQGGLSLKPNSRITGEENIMSIIEDLVAAYRILAEHGVIDAYGHVSVRSDLDPMRYLLARSIAPELVMPEDIMEYDLDSNPIDPRGRESVRERFIHGEIFKARPDVNAVVHNHSPSVVPFSVTTVAMRPLVHMAAFVGEGVPNFEIRDAEKGTDLLVKTPYLGQALAKTLGGSPAALMRGHGSVTVGGSLPRAVGRSTYFEISARMQLQAIAIAGAGGQITYLDEQEVHASVPNQDYARAWPMWRAQALARLKPQA